ncbi:hypothetical protein FQ330_02850 [Agrococcus sediminis]|uniref:MFS transporter n=1 Tax=Agrococcus sediminis TaxID=2599924 RepID=A0A5M8QQA1_9MICO|nr:hypothetical protein [Agrococcus sediminis]KAA6436362.1 hypothetical protein FQ330_02850 [Agrococcus sediminis]
MARRLALHAGAHALAWAALGAAAASTAADAVGREGSPVALALGAAVAVAAAALALLVLALPGARRLAPRAAMAVGAALALAALAGAAALALLEQPIGVLPAAALGLAAGLQLHGSAAAAATEPALAPRVRPAPTLLAAALGTALVAGAAMLGVPTGAQLAGAAVLQLGALALAIAAGRAASPAAVGADADERLPEGDAHGADPRPLDPRPLDPQALGLLALAAAGAAAIAALRPALSALGAESPQPAWPAALTLALGALLGPPLAVLAERLLGARALPAVATLGGVAALAAPIARPGALDLVAAAFLGVSLAASVALVELARRAGVRTAPATGAVLLFAGAAGAALAALLLAAVPLPDVVLGAALACLVAALGAWSPTLARSVPDARDGRRNWGRGDDPKGSSLPAPPFS